VDIDVEIRNGTVYLTDGSLEYRHDGGIDDGMLASTSHLSA